MTDLAKQAHKHGMGLPEFLTLKQLTLYTIMLQTKSYSMKKREVHKCTIQGQQQRGLASHISIIYRTRNSMWVEEGGRKN
jgi:hypothetical protein